MPPKQPQREAKPLEKPLRIAIIHPNFEGMSGSTRLFLNAALSFEAKGHATTMFTIDYNLKKECFSDEHMVNIVSINSHFPSSIGGYCRQVFSFLKCILLVVLQLTVLLSHDIIICDQFPAAIILLFLIMKLMFMKADKKPTLVYYCHYPEFAYLGHLQKGILVRLYRGLVNIIEKSGIQCVDILYANSNFSKNAIMKHYPQCRDVDVLYPGISQPISSDVASHSFFKKNPICDIVKNTNCIVSINRFSIHKSLERALVLTSELKKRNVSFTAVIAGGGNDIEIENLKPLHDLVALCKSYSLSFTVAHANEIVFSSQKQPKDGADVLFIVNATNEQKSFFLSHSKALLYTASGEHFGMGIAEGMLSHCLPVAMASGGPLEIIEHMRSGYLMPQPADGESFSPPADLVDLLARLYDSNLGVEEIPQDLKKIVDNGFTRAKSLYTIDIFTKTIVTHYYESRAKIN